MSPRSRRRGRSLALKVGLICALAAAVATGLTVVFVAQSLGSAIHAQNREVLTRGWALGLTLAVIAGLLVGFIAYLQGASIASRLTELGLGVAKMGRGSVEVRLRYRGKDEVAALGRALQYLANDFASISKDMEQAGGLSAAMDPLVREMRDRTLPRGLPQLEGYELDGALSAGTRGGLEYFDCVVADGGAVLFLVGNEGAGAMSAVAARMARDELMRALQQAPPRRALSHTNRVLNRELPKGVCATACLLSLQPDEAKLYQAGFRAPLLLCSAGRLSQLNAEGIALGLDEGPVFEKGLRSTTVPMASGVRLVLANEAALRLDEFQDLVLQHSPKHTAPFMNFVLGGLAGRPDEGGLREDVILLTAKRWVR